MAGELTPALSGALAAYGPLGAGLAIGVIARYGLTLNEKEPVAWRQLARRLLKDALLFCGLGLITLAFCETLGLKGNAVVFVAFLAELNADRLVEWVRDTFFNKVQETGAPLVPAIKAAPGPALLPGGTGPPNQIALQAGTPDSSVARAGAALTGAYRRATRERPPADQIEALKRLDAVPPVPARPTDHD